jgi:putative NADPH-quinone reductase
MARRIAIIQGHPDPSASHFCHALADAYEAGARKAGHDVRKITVAALDFPVLRTQEDFLSGAPSPEIGQCQADIAWADHLVLFYPLWLGTMPALLKAFLEQVFRPGFAFEVGSNPLWAKRLKGKSVRVIITMGMPAFFYRWYFRAHSLKSLERNVLGFCGIGPIRESLVGMVEAKSDVRRKKWLARMAKFGAAGD